jgi:hypothetical protein
MGLAWRVLVASRAERILGMIRSLGYEPGATSTGSDLRSTGDQSEGRGLNRGFDVLGETQADDGTESNEDS